jgi:hypothetical protein
MAHHKEILERFNKRVSAKNKKKIAAYFNKAHPCLQESSSRAFGSRLCLLLKLT